MNFSNLKEAKGSTRKGDVKIGVTATSTSKGNVKTGYDVKYLGEGNFRIGKEFITKADLDNKGFILVSDPNATLATVKELALKIVEKSEARYFGVPRAGKNPKTGVVVDKTKNSTLISSGVLEAYLINTGIAQKDVKTAFTLSKVENEGNTYFIFDTTAKVAETNTAQMELPLGGSPEPAVSETQDVDVVNVDEEL